LHWLTYLKVAFVSKQLLSALANRRAAQFTQNKSDRPQQGKKNPTHVRACAEQGCPPMKLEEFRCLWQRQTLSDGKLPAAAKLVAIAISWHMNRDGRGIAWPGIELLANLTSYTQRTVYGAIKELEAVGHMTITRQHGRSNRYQPKLLSGEVLKISGEDEVEFRGGVKPSSGEGEAQFTRTFNRTSNSEPIREPLPHRAAKAAYWEHYEERDKRYAERRNGLRAFGSIATGVARAMEGTLSASALTT
jgi:hypothetical protein